MGLAGSIAWSVGVWWIGEGLGGVLNGTANPVNGAPGAVIIYALLAVLLWPSDRVDGGAPFIAARAVGTPVAKGLWVVLWGSLSYFAVVGANRSPQGLHDLIGDEAAGEPGWMAWIDRHAAGGLDHRGLAATVVLAVVLAVVAVGITLPPRVANASLVVAMAISAGLWVVGENLGALFTNGATDVDSGPLLVLLALAYWSRSPDPGSAPGARGGPDPGRATEVTGADVVDGLFAALMVAVAVYAAGRLVAAGAGPVPPIGMWTWPTS